VYDTVPLLRIESDLPLDLSEMFGDSPKWDNS